MNLSKILGFRYDSLEEANEFVQPDYLVITDNNETYFIVHQKTYVQGPYQLGYEII